MLLPTIFGDSLRTTFSAFFAADFNLSSCEFDDFTFTLFTLSFYTDNILVYNMFRVLCEKPRIVSFASSIMKNVILSPGQSRFAVKVICCIISGATSRACCLLKSIAIIL